MIVICDNCRFEYQLDPLKLGNKTRRFKCKKCSAKIIVRNTDNKEVPAPPSRKPKEPRKKKSREITPSIIDAPIPIQEVPRKKGIGLTTKVILLMLLVSLLPGCLYFAFSSKQSSKRIIEETSKTGFLLSGLLTSEVDEWIDKNVRVLKTLAKSPSIITMNSMEQKVLLKALHTEYPWVYLAFTTDSKGMNVARSDDKPLKNYSNRQYIQDVVLGADISWQNVIGKTSKKPALVLAVPISRNGTIVGILAAAMTRDTISELITNINHGQTGKSFLVDQTGKVVAHRNIEMVLEQQDMSNHPLFTAAKPSRTTRVEFVDDKGHKNIGFSKSTKWGWVLAIHQKEEEAFMALKKAQLFAYSLLALTIIVIFIIAVLASRALVAPIRRLTDAANKISYGDLEVEIGNTSKDEIGELADAVIRMQDSIKLSILRLQRLKKK